jgi:hypothetical protein
MAGGCLPDAVVRRINLCEALMDAHPTVVEPPEDAPTLWSEAQIRAYFSSGGVEVPAEGAAAAAAAGGAAAGEDAGGGQAAGDAGRGGNEVGSAGAAAVGASLASLDIDGAVLAPSTRPDGLYLCQRVGCTSLYAPDQNPAGGRAGPLLCSLFANEPATNQGPANIAHHVTGCLSTQETGILKMRWMMMWRAMSATALAGGCRYHAGAPEFRDGSKKWQGGY